MNTRSMLLPALLVPVLLGGCVSEPLGHRASGSASEPPVAVATQILFYPAAGQSQDKQDRDRYECNRWAIQQSGFDPAAPHVPPHQRVTVVSAPSGANAAAGAIEGAMVGAAVSSPRSSGAGAILGAIAGVALGAAADDANARHAAEMRAQADQANRDQVFEVSVANFRRAMSACLAGRGYTVY